MQVTIQEVNKISRKIDITVPVEQIIPAMESKIKKLSQTVKWNGFRPGNVPMNLIKQKYGMAVYQEVIDELINSGIKKAIEEHNLDPIEQLSLESINNDKVNLENLEDLKCVFKVDVYPDFELKEFSELSINTSEVKISEEDIDKHIEISRKELGSFVEVEKEAQLGDLLTIDYESFTDGQKIIDGDRKNIDIVLEESSFVEGFGTGLIGTKACDNITLNLNFPPDYPESSLADKPLEIKIHVHKVKSKQLAEINEEFAEKLGIKDKDVSKIRDAVRQQLEKYAEELIIEKENDSIKELLIKTYPIDQLPEKFITTELSALEENCKQENKKQGINITELNPKIKEKLMAQAINNVHLTLILRKIIQKYNLSVDSKLLQQKLSPFENLLKVMYKSNNNKNYYKFYDKLKKHMVNSSILEIAIDFVREKSIKIVNSITLNDLAS